MNCCEEGPLKKLGDVGLPFFGSKKLVIVVVTIFLIGLSFILSMVSMSGSSDDDDTVENTAWTHGKYDKNGLTFDIYYGLTRVVGEGGGLDYADCSSGDCQNCEDAGNTALNCSIFLFLCTMVLMISSVLRIVSDKVLHKTTFIVVSAVALLVMIIGMGSWNDQCVSGLPTDGYTYSLGPGLSSMVAAFFFILISMILHLLIPVSAGASTTEALAPNQA